MCNCLYHVNCETCHKSEALHTVHFSATVYDEAETINYCCICYNKVAGNFPNLKPCSETHEQEKRPMKPLYKVVTWHGESGSLFYIVDTNADDIEVIETHHDRATAERRVYTLNWQE